ncbi:MAG: putative DNA binding domain-containing protein [Prevotellaceae bacterium]|jgi:ATP-dependent DNA helicase RecG|nr:putative DNA binding domain-containing protein [Prevotellaceae bacterium]
MLTENQHVELKSSFNEDVIETLTAFSNTKGGRVLVGIDDNGLPAKGFAIAKESIQKWLNEIKTKTQPSIIPDIEIVKYKDSEVVEFFVQEFPIKPVAFRGRYFKRVKNSNHQLSPVEISNMNMASLQVSWDAHPAPNFSIKDIDFNKVARFISKVNSVGRFNLEGSPKECLEKLRLINKNTVSNAAALLFAKDGSAYNIHLGRFKTPSSIIDDKMLRLTLFDAVEETQKYLVAQMKVAFEITGRTTQRTEILEYPLPAIRELILNTLIHRDYLSPIDVQIKVFDSSITFFNPGELYGNLTVESLKTNTYQAYARNKLISEAFYLTGDIEKYGSGFRRIRNEIKRYPSMELVCEEVPNGFLVTISYVNQKTSTANEGINEMGGGINGGINKVGGINDGINEGINGGINENEGINDGINEVGGINEGINGGINEVEGINGGINLLLALIEKNPNQRIPFFTSKLNVPEKTIERWLKKLRDESKIIYKGSKKTGGYWKKA